MFSKGAKRKLDEDEEGLEVKVLEASVEGRGQAVGLEGLSKVSYSLQRQTIFNISLMKLYSQRPLHEASLERRVLINNMLRRIQEQLKKEGALRPLLLPPSAPPSDPMDEGFREMPPSFGVLSAAAQGSQPSASPLPSPHPMVPSNSQACHHSAEAASTPLEACLTPASLLEEDGGDPVFGSPLPSPLSPPQTPPTPALMSQSSTALPDPEDSSSMELGAPTAITRTKAANGMTTSPGAPRSPKPPQSPVTSSAPPGAARDCRTASAKAEAAAVFLIESRQIEPPPPASPEDAAPTPTGLLPLPSGFLSDLVLDDVFFADIDTSMYDFDPCTVAGSVGGALSKLPPVVNADEFLKSLALPYSGPTPQVSANQPFKIDLTELDHIMEVLVGS